MKVLKTRSAEEKDLEEVRPVTAELLIQALHAAGLVYPEVFLRELAVGLRQGGFLLLAGPPGCGKSSLALALARALTAGYRDRGFEFLAVRPDWRDPGPLLGGWDEAAGRYTSPPFLELWLRALRHKSKRYVAVLDGLDRASPVNYLAEVLASGDREASLYLHPDHLRCQPRAGLNDELTNFFVCHQDCSQCFFVTPGYPKGVTDAVRDFVPARAQRPENLTLIGTLESDAALPSLLRDRAWVLRVPPVSPAAMAAAGLLPFLASAGEWLGRAEVSLERAGQPVSPRRWRKFEALLGAGEHWETSGPLALGEAWAALPPELHEDPEVVGPADHHD